MIGLGTRCPGRCDQAAVATVCVWGCSRPCAPRRALAACWGSGRVRRQGACWMRDYMLLGCGSLNYSKQMVIQLLSPKPPPTPKVSLLCRCDTGLLWMPGKASSSGACFNELSRKAHFTSWKNVEKYYCRIFQVAEYFSFLYINVYNQ